MPEERDLLEKFVLDNIELDRLEGMLSDFNLFETLNLVNAEIRHSNVLAWLFNPIENHGLGTYFLNMFIKHFVSENKTTIDNFNVFDVEMFNYNDVEIKREWKNIDILIDIKELDKNIIIVIENKITAAEHSDQLSKYREIVEKEFNGYKKLFILLTPESVIPSDDAWINFNYGTVSELLDNITIYKKDLLSNTILDFIEHYNIILKRYIVGNSEIEKICKQIYKKHKNALDLIFQYKPDLVSDISDLLQTLINANSELIGEPPGGKTYTRFTTKKIDEEIPKISEGWLKSKRLLVYEFNNYDNRLVLRLYVGPCEKNYREELFKYFSQKKELFPLTNRPLRNKWNCVYQKEFLKNKDFEEKEYAELESIVRSKWNEFVREHLKEIDLYIEKWHRP
jgi:hypothetical protein